MIEDNNYDKDDDIIQFEAINIVINEVKISMSNNGNEIAPDLDNSVVDSDKDDKMEDENYSVLHNDNFPRAHTNKMLLPFNFDRAFDDIESENEDDEAQIVNPEGSTNKLL